MKIGVPKERRAGEARVAISPDTVKKYRELGFEVAIETGAGAGASMTDEAYKAVGATIVGTPAEAFGADFVIKVQRPTDDEIRLMKAGTILACIVSPYADRAASEACARQGVVLFAMEFMPRITRAQTMDVLSSQSNLAGYRAVIDASAEFTRALPMMMTAAGTVAAARVLILGAGVAGLQAIATARRLGAIVSAFDVRPAVKEQVQSLGAKFVEVASEETKSAETAGGYAKEMSKEYQEKQRALIHETLKKTDIAISTALIPGKPAPVLITEEMVKDMKPGSVIVDLAVEAGGNCPLSEPGKVVKKHGVTIVGHLNVPSRIAVDASSLYARNLYSFLATMVDKEKKFAINWDDEIIKGTLIAKDGKIVHSALATPA
ncbi:MAG: Re/Si-specific NAD(P)(+) transhydrogenase subunit alpha [Alphaproteobacteria bacterium]